MCILMMFLSFSSGAINKDFRGAVIDMIMAPKGKYERPMSFLEDAIKFVDEKVHPEDGFKSDYEEISLKQGDFRIIVERWIASMDQAVEINFDEVLDIQRIKCRTSNPYRDEFLIETNDEYIMFLWSTAD